jgi:pimeloyl-ACP methyl ester carboxylesterase
MALYYDVMGNPDSDQNLVFVHGSGCNRKFLRPLAALLKEFKCYMVDLPGHGNTDGSEDETVEGYIMALTELISGLSNVTLIGHSLGGAVCMGVAAQKIPSVKRSVLISTAAKFDRFAPEVHEMVAKQRINWPYTLKFLGSLYNINVLRVLLTLEEPGVLLRDLAIGIQLDVENIVSDITVPTLLMVGSRDILSIPEYSHFLRRKIKHSKLIIVPGLRHMLPIADRKRVAKAIRIFILRS